MAPQNPLDPDRIDISLDLIGGESLAHVQALTDQLGTLTTYLANIQMGTPAGEVAGMQRIAGRMHGGIQHGAHAYQSQGVGPTPEDAAGKNASNAADLEFLNQQRLRSRSRRIFQNVRSQGIGGAIDRELDIYGAEERTQARRRGTSGVRAYNRYDPLYSSGGSEGYVNEQMEGSPSAGASVGAVDPEFIAGGPGWRQAAMSNRSTWENAHEGIRLPPGGLTLSTQDKLRLASDFFLRRAERQYQSAPDDATAGQTAGRISGALRLAEEQGAAPIQVAQDAYQRIRSGIARTYASGGALQQAGVQAGFERAGQINIPGTDIGITNPLDFFRGNSAAREGLNQRINIQRLRLMGGIDRGQAGQIVGGLAGMGWTGERGQNIAFDAIAPLVQQGMNPELAVGSFDQLMRQGNASMSDFLQTMDKLGESARTANMSLDEYQQGLMQFAETAQGLGATGVQGARLGRNLTDALGVAPQVAGQIIQSPLMQGVAMRQGYLPNEIGLMSGNQAIQATYQSLDLAMQATAGFRNQPIRDPATGRITTSGTDRQIAQVASITGLSTDLVKRMLRQRNFAEAAGRAESQIDAFRSDVGAARRAAPTIGRMQLRSNQQISPGDWVPVRDKSGHPEAVDVGDGLFAVQATVAGEGDKYIGHSDITGRRTDMDSKLNREFYTVKRTLAEGAPDEKEHPRMRADYMRELSALGKGDTGTERAADLNRFVRKWGTLDKQPEEQGPTVYVKFKGAAAKWFEQDNTDETKSRRASNSGGQTQAEIAAALPTSREAAAMQRSFMLTNDRSSQFAGGG
jgi:hypothetical protein